MAIIQSNTKYQTTMPLSVDTALLVWSCPCTGETHTPAISQLSVCVSSLLQANPKPTKQEVEDIFDGNICRCTGNTSVVVPVNGVHLHHTAGYRPILDAMKSFAVDNSSVSVDIEVSIMISSYTTHD